MAENKTDGTFMENLKLLLPDIRDASNLEAVAQMVSGLSQEDRDLLAAVQASPYRLTTLEQLQEFPNNTEYFVLEPSIRGMDELGWRYLAEHMDVLLSPELLDAIDPVPFGKHAMQEEKGCFTSYGYLTLSGDDWQKERLPFDKQPEKNLLSGNSLSRVRRNVQTIANPSRIRIRTRLSFKEVQVCRFMNMTKIIPLLPLSPIWENTTRARL